MKLVSGMHRSGTSLVARFLWEVGADLGNPNTFYRSDKWNPDGYFEQPEVHAINMPLINGPFWKLAYFRLPSTKTIIKRSYRFVNQIRSVAKKYDDKIVKETRFCLTLPAWRLHGANVERILVCLREPVEVAKSIQTRNRISMSRVYKLWLEHNQRLLENSEGIPLWFINYNNILRDDLFEEEVRSALAFFEIEPSASLLDSLRSLIKPPRTTRPASHRLKYPVQVEALWRQLLKRHMDQNRLTTTSLEAR